jgi:phosphatidylglycerol---prolipoprotein diacylglyceryl transferase
MIPYWNFQLGTFAGVEIHMFIVLVAVAIVIGDRIAVYQAVKRGLDVRDVKYMNYWIVVGGFVGAHLVSVIFYYPDRIKENPWVLLYIWAGLSSYGGFLGSILIYGWMNRRIKLPRLPYADSVLLGLAPAWVLGRLGCFTAHDHPGRYTQFFLAVKYPEGTRHDLGLYEALLTAVITFILYRYARRPRLAGTLPALACLLYAPMRFGLDFLRATDGEHPDPRYAGLTPAQWACVACFGFGFYLLKWIKTRPAPQIAPENVPPPTTPPTSV